MTQVPKLEKISPDINKETILLTCPNMKKLLRVACHVINRGENKNTIRVKQVFADGLEEIIYDCAVGKGKGLTILGINIRPNDSLSVFVTDKAEFSLSTSVKGKQNEYTQ